MKKKELIEVIGYIVFIILAAFALIYRNNTVLIFILLALTALILGIYNLINKDRKGLLFMAFGATILLTYGLYRGEFLDKSKVSTFFISFTFFLTLLLTLIFQIIDFKSINKIYNLKIIGKVVDLVKNKEVKNDEYFPIYEYRIGDMIYTSVCPYSYAKNIPKIGDAREILVCEDSKEEVYYMPSLSDIIKKYLTILLLIFICLAIIVRLFL